MAENHYLNGSAGFLALRVDNGILVTASGAHVGDLSEDDLTLVLSGDIDHDVVWCGKKPPSSETPMICEIFHKYSGANAIIHGHCRDITYSPKTLRYISKGYIQYGNWNELWKISEQLSKYNFCIMNLHGEISIAQNFDECLRQYSSVYNETTTL